MKIFNTIYNLNKDKTNLKIVLISDIHYYSKKDICYLNKVLKEIKNIHPNYICISGDITDLSIVKDQENFVLWFKKLSKITKVVVTLGNHEFLDKKDSYKVFNYEFIELIKQIENVYFLYNECVEFDDISFFGVVLPIEYYKNESSNGFYEYLKFVKPGNKYNVMLIHSPVNICNESIIEKLNIDLILSGHMHNGLVPWFCKGIMKNNGFISPLKKLFPKNCYGHIKIKNTSIIISSGLRIISHLNPYKIFKFLYKGEIVQINIKKH